MEGILPLASGSKGNSLFIGTKKCRLLVDAGISAKVLKERLARFDIDLKTIDAILVTHEHTDHILGLRTLSLQYNIPIFCNKETAKAITRTLNEVLKFKIFSTEEPFSFGDLSILPFSILHDTLDPVAFTLTYNDFKIGLCTDIGFATSLVAHHLKQCHYLLIEANHEPEMVHACSRPVTYKQRVLSRIGHLSNQECGQLLKTIWHHECQRVTLAHLSSECNTPTHATTTIASYFEAPPPLFIAPQETSADPFLFPF